MALDSEKWAFLEQEYLSSSISGALAHSGTYKDEEELPPKADGQPDKGGPDAVGKAFRTKLSELAKLYEHSVTGEEHIRNINKLAKSVLMIAERFASAIFPPTKLIPPRLAMEIRK